MCPATTPNELLKQLNQLHVFLWKETDEVRRVSAINEYGENDGS